MALELSLTTADGTTLAGVLYEPEASPRGAVLVASAMGVPQSFYRAMGEFLAAEGFAVLTFDYRGLGRSRTRPLRAETGDLETWARQDAGAALGALRERYPGVPTTWLGHSLGGQLIPMVPGISAVDRLVLVAAGSGYWRHNAPRLRRRVWIFWYGAVPLLTPVFGYFPGARLGMVGDLPRGVIRQWRRWCMHPEYAVGVEGEGLRREFAAVKQPLTCFSFTDDELLSRENIAVLYGFFTGARGDWQHVAPAEVGLDRIGHFGFFRRGHERGLWQTHLLPALAAAESGEAQAG